MSTPLQQLVDQIAGALRGTGDPATQPWLFRPLLRLLAEGEPVPLDHLAEAAGASVEQVRQALATEPDTEYDADGRVVGLGLTQNPTAHHVETSGRALYGWCAMDTLMFPLILARPVRVVSTCPATGAQIRLTAEPEQVTDVEPATAVVSQVPAPRVPAVCAHPCATRAVRPGTASNVHACGACWSGSTVRGVIV